MSASSGDARRIASTLLHDVGKYVARTARNVGDRPIEGALASMLLKDVYETWRGARASARFEELARELAASGTIDPRIDTARARLAAIDARETAARSGDADALSAIAIDARAVEDALRALARELMDAAKHGAASRGER